MENFLRKNMEQDNGKVLVKGLTKCTHEDSRRIETLLSSLKIWNRFGEEKINNFKNTVSAIFSILYNRCERKKGLLILKNCENYDLVCPMRYTSTCYLLPFKIFLDSLTA